MLKKFLMAAGLAAAFSLSPQVAEAKVKVHIGVGQPGGYCYYNYDPFRCGGYGYYSGPEHFVPHPGYGYQDRVSCNEARWIVRERGFRDVRTTNCGGKLHAIIAKKRGGIFRVKVYSRNGRIHSIRSI
jgi:hypothetical protein